MSQRSDEAPPEDGEDLEAFVLELGRAQLAAGYPVDDVTRSLHAVTEAHGRPDLGIFVLPNAVLLDDPVIGRARVIAENPKVLRMDQAAAVHEIAQKAKAGEITPDEGLDDLDHLRDMKPRFAPWATILGRGLAAAGFALVFRLSFWGVAMAFLGGVFVGFLTHITDSHPAIQPLVPPLAAAVCAFAVFGFGSLIDDSVQPLRVVAAPMITLIPGAAITRATQELASGHIISGASRLVSSIVQILVLTFGVLVGGLLASVSPYDIGDLTEQRLPLGMAWVGAAIYAAGQILAFNEPRGSVTPVIVLLLIAFSVQQLVSWLLDAVMAAGVAAAVGLFVAILIQDRSKRGTPAFVLFTPVFWLLVPGSLGLVALAEAVTGTANDAKATATSADTPASPTLTSSLPSFDDLSLDANSSVLLVFAASIIAITIGMQIASLAGRMVQRLPELPTPSFRTRRRED